MYANNHLDIDKALDAAHRASESWARTSATERANILLKIAEKLSKVKNKISNKGIS